MSPVLQPFAEATHICVRSYRRNGQPVDTPVWHAVLDDIIYVGTPAHTGKVKRLRHTPRVQIAPCDPRGRPRGPWQDGTARLLTDTAFAPAWRAINARHPIGSRILVAWLRLRDWHYVGIAIHLDTPSAPSAPPEC